MRSVGTVLKQVFAGLSVAVFIVLAVAVFFVTGGDVILPTAYSLSPVIRHFSLTTSVKSDATAFFRQTFTEGELRKDLLEQKLHDDHGFTCHGSASGTKCVYFIRGLVNCVRSIDLELSYGRDAALSAVTASSYGGCDA